MREDIVVHGISYLLGSDVVIAIWATYGAREQWDLQS